MKILKKQNDNDVEYNIRKFVFDMSGPRSSIIKIIMEDGKNNIILRYDRNDDLHVRLDKVIEEVVSASIDW